MRKSFLSLFGQCPRCARVSLVAAIVTWTSAVLTAYLVRSPFLASAFVVIAIGLTGLWLTHLISYAWRATCESAAIPAPNVITGGFVTPRRQFFSTFIKCVSGAAVATVFPRSAFSQVFPCDRCRRFQGSTCYECCRCQNQNCIRACKESSDYNMCINGCSQTFRNCNQSCR